MNIDNNIIIILLIGSMVLGYNHMKTQYDNLHDKIETVKNVKQNLSKNKDIDVIRHQTEIINKLETIDLNRDRDYRALADPMYPPLQRNPEYPQVDPSRAINIKTRGDGGPYQQVGSIHKQSNINADGTSPGSNNDALILPLFGKKTYDGSRHWNYYTVSNNNVKIPLTVQNKDCTEDRGCEEIEDNSTINIAEYNGEFKVKTYNFDKPKYIPYV